MSQYSIWVLEYSYVSNYHKSGVLYGAHNQGYVKLPYCYALIKGNGRVAMVDVGYNNKDYGKHLADKFGVENWHSPEAVLGEIGLSPKSVDTVFVTHAHFDHFGNVEDFPNATFYIQEREIAKWVWAMSLPDRMRWMNVAVDPGDIVRGVDLARQKRLVTIDGAKQDVLPDIDLHAAFDSHTYGSMWVTVRNGKDDTWVLAGDLVYVFDNIEGSGAAVDIETLYVPVGLAVGSQTNLVLATEEMMKQVGHEARRVIPIHEERLKDRFPSRITQDGLRITEICLADGETSRVQ
ncbi:MULTISPECIES: N-acyl homoserine lactonase family protein [unclassified Mesorhizobium]|uniref:N-acyl homoserine lactonase family protein n=1 Tax=unclassified Mesorhizobium TaxID=325217 RepID=UPI00112C9668|nr:MULTISPECIES: N-acyl homoserine lactonase family protein [unclassified Mesorhizobium]MBZ9699588.1 N-acyl homoserine lactonase family protein [Mesorhizobium sp. CO1-1-3]MBZ9893926.1 N-acyl homoserine lactonase family protein [Mesorhizobium sp. BR1-1-6]MBZ9945840.1 N-acyl homoserine lactonase family protein [Mesorhizobium sp. BR1-1-11]MBZ9980705.1 N-acyl homoserine lactonase family protein [Mesorhizobium sp. BR-1-1-8]MCA0026578.1 N-acyl homoserine lactonase family protein [Mesorhizobium sp. B